ncbi:MAG: PIN domain-containing protein [Acidobacteriaceae bacterium]|nr:PIN domain-containing protein [Acidobacteriaceae bacterium]
MFLVDTSVWIDHFRSSNASLRDLLNEGIVLMHPFVMGELACGSLKNRKAVLANLQELPLAISAEHQEVMRLMEQRSLWSKGIGWIDAHLIASALLSGCRLYTLDGKMREAAASARVQARGAS